MISPQGWEGGRCRLSWSPSCSGQLGRVSMRCRSSSWCWLCSWLGCGLWHAGLSGASIAADPLAPTVADHRGIARIHDRRQPHIPGCAFRERRPRGLCLRSGLACSVHHEPRTCTVVPPARCLKHRTVGCSPSMIKTFGCANIANTVDLLDQVPSHYEIQTCRSSGISAECSGQGIRIRTRPDQSKH